MKKEVLQFKSISYNAESDVGVKDISLSVSECERVMVFSENQDTSVSEILLGLKPADTGEVFVCEEKVDIDNEKSLRAIRRRIGVVRAASTLIDEFTLMENIMLDPLYHRIEQTSEFEELLDYLTKTFEIAKRLDEYPGDVSTGAVRACIYVRELIRRPNVMVLEHPTYDLGVRRIARLIEVKDYFKEKYSTGWLIISDDPDYCVLVADRVEVLKNGALEAEMTRVEFKKFIQEHLS